MRIQTLTVVANSPIGLRPPQGLGSNTISTSCISSAHSPLSSMRVRMMASAANASALSRSKARGAKLSEPRPVVGGNDLAAALIISAVMGGSGGSPWTSTIRSYCFFSSQRSAQALASASISAWAPSDTFSSIDQISPSRGSLLASASSMASVVPSGISSKQCSSGTSSSSVGLPFLILAQPLGDLTHW